MGEERKQALGLCHLLYLPTRIEVNNAKELCTVISLISTRDKTSPKIIGLLEEQHKAINTPEKILIFIIIKNCYQNV